MTLKVKVNYAIFESSLTYPKMHNWCEFGDPS